MLLFADADRDPERRVLLEWVPIGMADNEVLVINRTGQKRHRAVDNICRSSTARPALSPTQKLSPAIASFLPEISHLVTLPAFTGQSQS